MSRNDKISKIMAQANAMLKTRTHKTKMKTIAVCCIVSVLIVALAVCAMFYFVINGKLNTGDKSAAEISAINDVLSDQENLLEEPFYMLLVGSDSRTNSTEKSRSDTNIVARIDPIDYTVTLVSIPRDTKIELETHGEQKFNAAYAFGGVASTIQEANNLLGIEISHYAEINFSNLIKLIDSMGGVYINVDTPINDYHTDDGDGNHYMIAPGKQTLSGAQALAYARSRQFEDGDFTRQSHQRQLIEAIVNEIILTPPLDIPDLITKMSECVTTDLSVADIIRLANHFANSPDGITIYSCMVPSYTQWEYGVSYVITDTDLLRQMMRKVRQGEDPSGFVSTKVGTNIGYESEDELEIDESEDISDINSFYDPYFNQPNIYEPQINTTPENTGSMWSFDDDYADFESNSVVQSID